MKYKLGKNAMRLLALLLAFSLVVSPVCVSATGGTGGETGNTIATDPIATDPVATDSTATDPVATDPVATDPVATDPVATDPVATDPVATDPIATDPVATDPVATDPVATDPVATDSVATDPVATNPIATDPVATDPAVTEPENESVKRSRGLILTSTGSKSGNAVQVSGGIVWTLESGKLTISPAGVLAEDGYESGQMIDYTQPADTPWSDNMDEINSVEVKSGVSKLGARSFSGADMLESVSLPQGLTTISLRAFQDCKSLTTINFPSTLRSIGDYAFPGCVKLQKVILRGTTITALGKKCFAGCTALQTLIIPVNVTSIGESAFGTHGKKIPVNLKTLEFDGALEAWKNVTIDNTDNAILTDGTCTVSCTDGKWNAGYTIDGTVCYKITDGTLYIRCNGVMPNYEQGTAPWYGNASNITDVVLENGITAVGANAFEAWETITCTYGGDFEALKTNSSKIGNKALFGEEESGDEGGEGGEVTPEENVTGGIVWNLSEDGKVLTISPATTPETEYISGAMPNYTESAAPWYENVSTITTVVFEGNVTYVGSNAFYGCNELTCAYDGLDTLKAASSKVGNTALFGIIVGKTGDVNYELDTKTGIMTLSGAGETESYAERANFDSATEWKSVLAQTRELVVEEGVTKLGNRLFTEAPVLTKVTLPASLETIGARCFADCTALVEVVFSSTVETLGLKTMGEVAFNGCTALKTIDLSRTQLTALPKKAFSACSQLTTISLPVITSIGECCFGATGNNATSNLKTVNFKGSSAEWSNISVSTAGSSKTDTGATQIKNTQLKKCTIICSDGEFTLDENYDVIIPEPEEAVTGGVAWNLSEDGKVLTISPATTPETGYDRGAMLDYAEGAAPWYGNASTITTVIFEDGITYVGKNAFYGCSDLECDYADMETLKTNSDLTGNEALFGKEESGGGEGGEGEDPVPEENVICGVKWTLSEDGVLTISKATALPANPDCACNLGEMCEKYTNADDGNPVPWDSQMKNIKSLVVEEGITKLGNRLCNGASRLTRVSLPESLTTIGERCFVGCTSLENITLPDSLVSLGAYAFTGCTKLTVVDLWNTQITTLGAKAFAGCGALTTLSIPETITGSAGIASDVFCDYGNVDTNKLTRLNYEGSLATWNSFKNRTHKDNPNLANGTCTVYCKDGIWNANYTSVDNLCYKLEDGVLSILCDGEMLDYAEGTAPWFAQASDITSVILENGTTSVGKNAFDGCVKLTDVTICAGVTKVGENAFVDCVNLANVHFYGTPTQWAAVQNASGNGNGPLFSVTITSGYTGKCGDNAIWEYDQATKTLTISGIGPMWDWHQGTYQTKTPWIKFNDEIETIKIGYGITNTGRYAFCYMGALKNLEFVTNEDGFTTVETIGGYCFCWENQLTTLTLPEGVRFLSGRAFSRSESISTVYLPSTLESIDMYAFKSEDKAVTINKVYYNGTKEDWVRKVYVSAQGDNLDQLFDSTTEWFYLKEYTDYTDVAADAWYKDAVYYLKDQGMAPEGGTFGVGEKATMDWVLNALYIRAGSSGAYVDGLDWAMIKNIVAADTTAVTEVSLTMLADILYRATLYNGHLIDLGERTALDWCQTYIPTELTGQTADAALTRAQAASILTAYLQSTNGYANRYDEMRDEMKEAYETSGGDGKMHILALHHAGKGKVGDSTLILLPGGEVMLIDTFRSDGWQNYLKATLDSLGVTKLDYLVLSHGHDDHDANLSKVINYIYENGYTIGNYWSAGDTTSTRETAAIKLLQEKGNVTIESRLRAGAQRIIGSGDNQVVVDFLWPTTSGASGDSNNGSLLMKLTYDDSSYITGGDLFLDAEEEILELYKDNPDALRADVLKTNHHGSYSSNGSDWVAAIDPKALITHSDDTGDSAQCYEYSRDGRAWFTAGRDGGVMVTMDGKKNITITTGFDTNLRQNIYACGEKGHIYEGRAWEFDENGHWRRCEGFWLCGATEPVLVHAGGTATCQSGKICETCGFEYTGKGNHVWRYTADGNVIHADCTLCDATGTLSLEFADTAPVYDGTEKTVTASGSINGITTPDVVYEGSRVNAGTFTASIQLGSVKAELSVTIGKRNVTVKANDQTIAYGGSISNTEITATGLLDGHSVSATLTPSTGNVTTNGTITPGAAVITADGTDVTANYNITYASGTLIIVCDDGCSYTYTDNGDGTHKKSCTVCGYVENTSEAHIYGDPVYAWAEDYAELTVTLTCDCGNTLTGSTTDITKNTSIPAKTAYTGTVMLNGQTYSNSVEVAGEIISVDISWGEMSFTYTDGDWNSTTHTYGEGKWTADNEGGDTITVSNSGNTEVTVAFTYTKAVTEVTAGFTKESVTLAENEHDSTQVKLDGKPNDTMTGRTLGTITVSITGGGE